MSDYKLYQPRNARLPGAGPRCCCVMCVSFNSDRFTRKALVKSRRRMDDKRLAREEMP